MAFSEHCPCGQSVALDLRDKIVIDRETFRQILSLINRSTDTLSFARNHEIFIQCLDNYLDDLTDLDDFQLSKISLLLRVWLDIVPENLGELAEYLGEARELISVIFAASQLGGNRE